jgi:signal transduction histidine kinase
VTRSRARLLEIGLAVISIALAGIVVMIRRLLGKPLDRLLQTMARVEAGDLTARVAPVSSDELGLLAERFNRMADRLLEITDHQEEIIRERTEKLRGAEIHAMQQEKLASLGVLSAGVAHEIGNPLAAISAVTQLLRRRDQEPERIEKLDLILAHISRISSIVRRLGELARIQPVERSPVDLGEVIETTLTLARFDPRSKSIQVVTELAPGLPPILGVAPRLLEVFLNISLNAFDAMPVGGRLTVRARPARSGVEVEFEDAGAGMTDEVRARIFEPFFTTKPVGQGTGLGLAVSHRVVEDHGGTLEVESAPGRGTRFAVWLPGGAGTEAAP